MRVDRTPFRLPACTFASVDACDASRFDTVGLAGMGGGGGGGFGMVTCGVSGSFTGFGADGAEEPPPKKNWPGLTLFLNVSRKSVKSIIF